jgi:hypothetical protein
MWDFLKPIAYLLGVRDDKPKKEAPGWKDEWTLFIINEYYEQPELEDTFTLAKDIKTLRPDWDILTTQQRCQVLATFWKAVALYESNYDPNCQCVDVGSRSNKDTWSIGLLQLSVVDQSNWNIRLGYNYKNLLAPLNNLNLGILIMDKQIKKRGKILIPQGEQGTYWATIHPGGRYDKSKHIIKLVQELKFDTVSKA